MSQTNLCRYGIFTKNIPIDIGEHISLVVVFEKTADQKRMICNAANSDHWDSKEVDDAINYQIGKMNDDEITWGEYEPELTKEEISRIARDEARKYSDNYKMPGFDWKGIFESLADDDDDEL